MDDHQHHTYHITIKTGPCASAVWPSPLELWTEEVSIRGPSSFSSAVAAADCRSLGFLFGFFRGTQQHTRATAKGCFEPLVCVGIGIGSTERID